MKKVWINTKKGVCQFYCTCICNFSDYVDEIYQTFVKASKDELKDAATKLNEKTPAPMNTMLEKQPRAEALQKRTMRSKMVVKDVPPTTPGIFSCTVHRLFYIVQPGSKIDVFC